MKLIAAVLLGLSACVASAESMSLPVAPEAVKAPRVFKAADWSLTAALYASHAADYLSTEQCVHGARCREVVLPQFLVHRNGLFAAYEFATASLETAGAYELSKHGHRGLARVIQSVNVSYTAKVVAHNYELGWQAPTQHGLQYSK